MSSDAALMIIQVLTRHGNPANYKPIKETLSQSQLVSSDLCSCEPISTQPRADLGLLKSVIVVKSQNLLAALQVN